MKKYIVLLFLAVSIFVNAESWYKLTKINIKPLNSEWSGWEYCSPEAIDMHFEPEKGQITIYSKSIQIINYVSLNQNSFREYTLLKSKATDSNYNVFDLSIYHYDNGKEFLLIEYSYISYMYTVIPYNEYK